MLTGADIWIAACVGPIILITCLGNLGRPKDKY
jgi:hypothetical protein